MPKIRSLFVSFSVNSSPWRAIAVEEPVADLGVRCRDDARALLRGRGRQARLRQLGPPGPRVAEPERRKQVDRRGLRSAVRDGDPDEAFLRSRLGVLDDDVEVAIVVEDAGVDELVLELPARAACVLRHQVVVRKRGLRVPVQPLHVRVGGRRIEVGVVLLHVLAVVAFGVTQAEEALLQNRIVAVPERQRETQALLEIGKAREPVLAPVVRA